MRRLCSRPDFGALAPRWDQFSPDILRVSGEASGFTGGSSGFGSEPPRSNVEFMEFNGEPRRLKPEAGRINGSEHASIPSFPGGARAPRAGGSVRGGGGRPRKRHPLGGAFSGGQNPVTPGQRFGRFPTGASQTDLRSASQLPPLACGSGFAGVGGAILVTLDDCTLAPAPDPLADHCPDPPPGWEPGSAAGWKPATTKSPAHWSSGVGRGRRPSPRRPKIERRPARGGESRNCSPPAKPRRVHGPQDAVHVHVPGDQVTDQLDLGNVRGARFHGQVVDA